MNKVIWSRWQDFATGILLTLLVPLSPIALEYLFKNEVSDKSLIISAAMYVLAKGFLSKHQLIFTLSLLAGLILALFSGVCQSKDPLPLNFRDFAIWCIGIIFLLNLSELFERHMIDGEPFFRFK